MSTEEPDKTSGRQLVEGVDFYFEEGLMVLTRDYLLNRGFCCNNSCRHCPYGLEQFGKSEQEYF